MPVAFIGNTDWEESQQPEWSSDGWQIDNLRVVYRGRSTALEDFEETLQDSKWEAHVDFPNMFLSHWATHITSPSFPSVEITYIGFRGDVPPLQTIDGNSIGQATGEGHYNGEDPETGDPKVYTVSGTVVYKSNRTTYNWWESSTPSSSSPYNTVTNEVDPLEQVVYYKFVDRADGKPVGQIPLSGFTTFLNSMVRGNFVNDYTVEEVVPGHIWKCSAQVDYRVL